MKKEKYNSEGYADLTAYSAIRNTDNPNPGELWSMELTNGEQRQCIFYRQVKIQRSHYA